MPSPQQLKQLQIALINAFPSRALLQQFLYFELDKNLNEITRESDLQKIVFKLIQTAESEGWLIEIVIAARKENPGNSDLEAIALELLSTKTPFATVVEPKQEQQKIKRSSGIILPLKVDRNINMGSGNYNERIEGDYIQGNFYTKGKQSNFNLQGTQFAGGLVDADTVNAHQIGGNITNNAQAAQTETNNSAVKKILILASNPKTTIRLHLDEEVREIDAGLQRARKRDLFDLKQRWAVRVQDLYQALLDFKPQFVHFSGHGSGDNGLVLEDEAGNLQLVETVALARLFELFANTIECVVLNACYSEAQACAIAQHIPYVIGMNKEIGDQAAIRFATGFYSALGSGESVEFAYKLGCVVIQLDGIAEHLTPLLKLRFKDTSNKRD